MSEEKIIDFVETIVKNGVKNNLDKTIIKRNLVDFGTYLIRKKYVDFNVLNSIIFFSCNVDVLIQKVNNNEKINLVF